MVWRKGVLWSQDLDIKIRYTLKGGKRKKNIKYFLKLFLKLLKEYNQYIFLKLLIKWCLLWIVNNQVFLQFPLKKNKKYSSNVKWFRNNFYLTPPNKKNATGQIKVIQPPYGCCWSLNNLSEFVWVSFQRRLC